MYNLSEDRKDRLLEIRKKIMVSLDTDKDAYVVVVRFHCDPGYFTLTNVNDERVLLQDFLKQALVFKFSPDDNPAQQLKIVEDSPE